MAIETKTMFDDCKDEPIPTSIEDCTKPDKVTETLWKWARNLELIGQVMLGLIILSGLLGAIDSARFAAETTSGSTFSMMAFFASLLNCVTYALIAYCAYHVIAMLVASLARIVHSNRTTARLAEYQARISSEGR